MGLAATALLAAAPLLAQAGPQNSHSPDLVTLQLVTLQLVTLQQAGSRTGSDYAATYEGRNVRIRGQVAEMPVWAVGSTLLSVTDASGYGLILRGPAAVFSGLAPGVWIEATGTIFRRGGLPMLTPDSLERSSDGAPPPVKNLPLAELSGFRYLGLPVETTGTVRGLGANTGGKLVVLTDGGHTITAFLPNPESGAGYDLSHIHTGDHVRVRGLATQYDLQPPYNGDFQIVVASLNGLEVIDAGPVVPAYLAAAVAVSVTLLLAAWWLRERRVNLHRRQARAFHALSEDIIAAGSPAQIAEKLSSVVPEVIRATSVELYLFNRRTKSLERVATSADPEPMAAPIDAPPEGMAHTAVVCFRNRTVLNIPDARRNPLVKAGTRTSLPRSAMFLPLLAQQEALGVLELDNFRRVGYLSPEHQAAAQHLANQVAASLRLQAQQVMREQLFRSEKLAATGQLISGVASELKAPLDRIVELARALEPSAAAPSSAASSAPSSSGRPAREPVLRELAAESRRAAAIVSRLISFAQEDGAAGSADVDSVIAGLIQFREQEWRARGIRVQNRLSSEAAVVATSRGHMEQVFLNLLVHAEQRAAETSVKTISIKSGVMAATLLVEIAYSALPSAAGSPAGADPFSEPKSAQASALGLGVCQGIVASLGGEIRFRVLAGAERFEVELPVTPSGDPVRGAGQYMEKASAGSTRPLTLMLVDPDAAAQRQLVSFLGARGHRVVPAVAEEAPDLVQRLRFDAVFWAVRTGGGRWSEFHDRLRTAVPVFVLLSDGYDHNLARSLEENGGFLLATPVQDAEAGRVLSEIAARTAAPA